MKAVRLLKDNPSAGLAEGDILEVDELSAQNMIGAGKAEEFDPDKHNHTTADLEEVNYGGKPVRTIDDIVDPDAKRMTGVMHVQRLVGADPGPPSTSSTAEAVQQGETPSPAPDAAAPAPDAAAPAADQRTSSRTSGGKAGSNRGASGAEPAGGDAPDGGASS